MPTLATRNNNPGNLRDPNTGNFRTFGDAKEGYAALLNDLQAKMTGTSTTGIGPSSSLADFAKVYAPESDNNNPAQYAANLANKLGVAPNATLGSLHHRIGEFADAIAGNEGYESQGYQVKPKFVNQDPSAIASAKMGQGGEEDDNLIGDLKKRASAVSTALADTSSGKINAFSGILQTAGGVAGGVSDVIQRGLELIPGVKQAEGLLGKGVEKLAGTSAGQSVLKGYQSFAQNHPELSNDINAGLNIASLIPIFKGLSVAKAGAGGLLGRALGKDVLESTIADVAPTVSKKSAASSIAKAGTKKSLITGEIKQVTDPAVREIAETVDKHVPGFSKLKTVADKVNATQDAVENLATQLKNDVVQSGKDRIFSFKELNSSLREIPKPTLLVGDMEKVYDKVIQKAVQIAKESGGKISDLFDARKEFDSFIKSEFPNLYSSDTLTPMRVAVKNIRNGMNAFIDRNLPEGLGFRERLLDQSRLFRAIENMAPKAVKEIGTTRIGRAVARHPVMTGLLKQAGKYALPPLIGVGTYEGAKRLFGE